MLDLTTVLLGVLIAIGLVVYAVSRLDERSSGYFYTLLMAMDVVLAGTVLLARLR